MHQLNNVISLGSDHIEFTLAYISKQCLIGLTSIFLTCMNWMVAPHSSSFDRRHNSLRQKPLLPFFSCGSLFRSSTDSGKLVLGSRTQRPTWRTFIYSILQYTWWGLYVVSLSSKDQTTKIEYLPTIHSTTIIVYVSLLLILSSLYRL
jgi:hypothetical protein